MKQLILRDFKREWKELTIVEIVLVLVPLLLGVLYNKKKVLLFSLASHVFSAPEEIFSLFGFVKGTTSGNVLFFMNFFIVILNFVFIWYSCARMGKNLFVYEKNGSIFTILQWYSKRKLLMEKYLWTVISSVVMYMFICIIAALVVRKCSVTVEIGNANFSQIIDSMGHGILVLVLLMSLTCACALLCRNSVKTNASGWAVFWTLGIMLIGNLYKIFDLTVFLLGKTGSRVNIISKFAEATYKLHYFSPLSWLNPYIYSENWGIRIVVAIIITIVSVLTADLIYQKRSFIK